MTVSIPLQPIHHSLGNTYQTPIGNVTAYPVKSSVNPYGFTIETDPPQTEPPSPRTPRFEVWFIWQYFIHLLVTIIAFMRGKQDKEPSCDSIIPFCLRHHLIVLTPPSNTPFPTWYPPSTGTRAWYTFTKTWNAVQFLRESQVPEIHILPHPPHLLSRNLIREGKVIFVGGMGIYITDEIGPYHLPDGGREVVAMEGHTIKREMILVFMPVEYAKKPDFEGQEFVEKSKYERGKEEEEYEQSEYETEV